MIEHRQSGGSLRAAPLSIERRTVPIVELRQTAKGLRVQGVAVPSAGSASRSAASREVFHRGAFRHVLGDEQEVTFQLVHGSGTGLPLATTDNGTLHLQEAGDGLRFVADLADVTEARDLLTLVRRGDVHAMSFAFSMDRDRGPLDRWDDDPVHGLLRTVVSVSDLFEISAVPHPAYPTTTIEVPA